VKSVSAILLNVRHALLAIRQIIGMIEKIRRRLQMAKKTAKKVKAKTKAKK
jgi:hypothetical protein